jgi:diguanylate cyclase (GGDEF)-like protein
MPADPVGLRQSLLQLLEADPPHEEKLLRQFESLRSEGQPLYASLLYILTHLSFTEAEARRHFRRILRHRERLRRQLKRDVGLRVALLDYFVNVNRELKNPKVIEISIYERTERSAVSDGLTGLYNHLYFLQALRREVQRSRRHGLKLSLVMIDLDDFKRVNDAHGHLEGDRVLVKAAALIQESLREIDIAARYGGEEFALILPETARAGAYVVADRIRSKIEAHFRRKRRGPRVTLSGGVAAYPDDASGVEDLVRRADEGLYRAKAAGKNQITLVEGERRRHPRVWTSHPVSVSVRGARASAARAKNISEGGLLLTLRKAVPMGSPVSLVIRPRDGAPVELRGEVVRSLEMPGGNGQCEVGVRLKPTSARSQMTFRRLAAYLAPA